MPDHDFLPAAADSSTHHVGSYRRRLPVSLERMYENTLDWEHLPYLHNSSFTQIQCLDAGAWGWRAKVTNHKGQDSELELKLDRSRRRWITTNLSGPSQGAEIWTLVSVLGPHEIEIVVDFFVPGVEPASREKVGRAYANAYTQLYHEDEAMMVARQVELDRRVEPGRYGAEAVLAGTATELASAQPTVGSIVSLRGREYVLRYLGPDAASAEDPAQWVAYPRLCPHQLGPLDHSELIDGVVTCPWHGYQFDVRSGANLSGQACRLTSLPEVSIDQGQVFIK